ncbi:hypothetical protein C8J57DRAFT_1495311 [Mycena rebaudengoi]|nr:hypothetical protein C8J57DRAFT_1495311 [Mycena rebaudengoi]
MSSLNMALIDICTRVDSKVILKNLEACRYHMKTFKMLSGLNQTLTLHALDLATANLNLRDGNHVAANTLFSACFAFLQIGLMVDIMLECLERLADLSTEMNNIQNTLRWAGIFLSLALTSKDRLAAMKALSCLGQISVAEADDETALSLFTAALDGFTFMDVHRWRADCMFRIADIYDKRGEPVKSIELWKAAQPLFERSSQANSVRQIDMRLAEVASAISERHEKQLQQLAKMNVLVGEPVEPKIVDTDKDSELRLETYMQSLVATGTARPHPAFLPVAVISPAFSAPFVDGVAVPLLGGGGVPAPPPADADVGLPDA